MIPQEQPVLYMKTNLHFLIISRSVLLRMRYTYFRESCRKIQNTNLMSNIYIFENRAVSVIYIYVYIYIFENRAVSVENYRVYIHSKIVPLVWKKVVYIIYIYFFFSKSCC